VPVLYEDSEHTAQWTPIRLSYNKSGNARTT